MTEVRDDRLQIMLIATTVSTTGKYKIFYGTHFDGKTACYDVGSINTTNGEIIKRHYERKEEALRFWDEFRKQMTAPRTPGESEEKDAYRIIKPN